MPNKKRVSYVKKVYDRDIRMEVEGEYETEYPSPHAERLIRRGESSFVCPEPAGFIELTSVAIEDHEVIELLKWLDDMYDLSLMDTVLEEANAAAREEQE